MQLTPRQKATVKRAAERIEVLGTLHSVRTRWSDARLTGAERDDLTPPRLRSLVGGSPDAESFLAAGRSSAAALRAAALERGFDLENPSIDVLDFGCGCGRTSRHWRRPVHGPDIRPELVAWCQEHLRRLYSQRPGATNALFRQLLRSHVRGVGVHAPHGRSPTAVARRVREDRSARRAGIAHHSRRSCGRREPGSARRRTSGLPQRADRGVLVTAGRVERLRRVPSGGLVGAPHGRLRGRPSRRGARWSRHPRAAETLCPARMPRNERGGPTSLSAELSASLVPVRRR
jgi:hypothetical protein